MFGWRSTARRNAETSASCAFSPSSIERRLTLLGIAWLAVCFAALVRRLLLRMSVLNIAPTINQAIRNTSAPAT